MNQLNDLVIRIKNSYMAQHKTMEIDYTKQKENFIKILVSEGFLEKCEVIEENKKKVLKFSLKYDKKVPAVRGIKLVSKPSLKVYTPSKGIRSVLGGHGISVISTSKGLMTGGKAREQNVGGELICQIW